MSIATLAIGTLSPLGDHHTYGSSFKQITYSIAMLWDIGNKVNDNKCLQILMPRAINTIRRLSINKKGIRNSYRSLPTDCMSNVNNLLYVKTTDNNNEVGNNMSTTMLNARSVNNKDHLFAQQLHETDVDIAVITETWLKDIDTEKAWLNQSELKQSNYDILLQNRPGPRKGGGITFMYKCQYSNDMTLLEKTNRPQHKNGALSLLTHPKKQALPHHRPISPPAQH